MQESDASDVTQDVLTKLVTAMRSFEYDPRRGSFRGWLKTVTRNAVRDLGRRWRAGVGTGDTQCNRFLNEISGPEPLSELASEIESQYEFELLAEAESRVKLRVKPETWTAYRMTAIDQLASTEVARSLGITISAVYVAKSRVIKLLREEVSRLDPGSMNGNAREDDK